MSYYLIIMGQRFLLVFLLTWNTRNIILQVSLKFHRHNNIDPTSVSFTHYLQVITLDLLCELIKAICSTLCTWHGSLLLMNNFNKTEAAVFFCAGYSCVCLYNVHRVWKYVKYVHPDMQCCSMRCKWSLPVQGSHPHWWWRRSSLRTGGSGSPAGPWTPPCCAPSPETHKHPVVAYQQQSSSTKQIKCWHICAHKYE